MPKFQGLYNSSLSSLVLEKTSGNQMLNKVLLRDFRNIKPFPERFFIENNSFMKWDSYLKVLAYLLRSYGLEWRIERIAKGHIIMLLVIYIYILGLWEFFFKRRTYSIFWKDFCMKTETPGGLLSLQLFESQCKTLKISMLSTAISTDNKKI